MAEYTDTHAHLSMLDQASIEQILLRAKMQGVKRIITVSTSEENWEANRQFAEEHEGVYYSLGLHPHDAIRWPECAASLDGYFKSSIPKKCVAIGEMGLDFYYEFSPREIQTDVFESQMQLAKRVGLPIIVHCRDSFEVLFSSTRKVGLGKRGGVMHCFTGNTDQAKEALSLGFKISFSGILTFKNSHALRETAKQIPQSEILIETDCPYLTPMPFRGKPNEPSYVVLTAEVLASTLSKSVEEIAQLTTENAVTFFAL